MKAYNKIHFIGIGGMGMSALARLAIEQGYPVTGSDAKDSRMTQRLRELGAQIRIGHQGDNVGDADLVVYSSAVNLDNPEILVAKERKILLLRRGEMLAEMMKGKKSVAVCGTHGKSTTTSMIGLVLDGAGLAPSIAVGANVSHFDGNAKSGSGEHFVAEADESDGSFLYMEPECAVVTNIEKEHMEHYGEMIKVLDAYMEFAGKIKDISFLGADCSNVREIIKQPKKQFVSYGLADDAMLRAIDIAFDGMRSRYKACYKGVTLGAVELSVPGIHNVVNSLAALGVALNYGVRFETIAEMLRRYRGAQRRFQVISQRDGITVVDDYGHHPTEVKATVSAARLLNAERLIGVFQPHRYTRTLNLKEEFAEAFGGLDKLILTDVYSACERPIEGVSTDLIYEGVVRSGHRDVSYLPKERILEHLLGIVRANDLVLFIGAGDIGNLAYEFAGQIGHECKVD